MSIKQPVGLTLLEQAVGAELAYYHQTDLLTVTAEDEAAWQQRQALYDALQPLGHELQRRCPSFARFVLERHGHSLHRYMARQLSPEAWSCWFTQGGVLAPFREAG